MLNLNLHSPVNPKFPVNHAIKTSFSVNESHLSLKAVCRLLTMKITVENTIFELMEAIGESTELLRCAIVIYIFLLQHYKLYCYTVLCSILSKSCGQRGKVTS